MKKKKRISHQGITDNRYNLYLFICGGSAKKILSRVQPCNTFQPTTHPSSPQMFSRRGEADDGSYKYFSSVRKPKKKER